MNIIKQQLLITLFTALMTTTLYVQAGTDTKKVLMVVSGNGQGEEQPGYEFDEFSKAYSVFKDNALLLISPAQKVAK
tara:strand:- start:88 stop:318 length:231 start_codon:yes stop_codon:yes gene_type:complete